MKTKKEFLNKIKEDLNASSIYHENIHDIGLYSLMYFDNKEKIISKNKKQKVLSYQKSIKNQIGEYPVIEIIVEEKTLKNYKEYNFIDIILF